MAIEKTETEAKTEVKAEKKTGICGKILTSIICLLIGAGAMFGVDFARVQETLDKAQTEKLVEIVAAETVETTIADEGIVNLAITDAKKEELTKSAIEKAKADLPNIWAKIKGAQTAAQEAVEAVKTGAEDVKAVVEEVKDKVEGAKAEEAAAPAVEQK